MHKMDLAKNLGVSQLTSKLRSEIQNQTLDNDGKIIESDGSGSYRLSVPPDNLTIDKESLMSHWGAVERAGGKGYRILDCGFNQEWSFYKKRALRKMKR